MCCIFGVRDGVWNADRGGPRRRRPRRRLAASQAACGVRVDRGLCGSAYKPPMRVCVRARAPWDEMGVGGRPAHQGTPRRTCHGVSGVGHGVVEGTRCLCATAFGARRQRRRCPPGRGRGPSATPVGPGRRGRVRATRIVPSSHSRWWRFRQLSAITGPASSCRDCDSESRRQRSRIGRWRGETVRKPELSSN